MGLSKSAVRDVCTGRRNSAGGFGWSFADGALGRLPGEPSGE